MTETIPTGTRVIVDTTDGVLKGRTCQDLLADDPADKTILISVDYAGGYLACRRHITVLEAPCAR